MMTNEEIRSKVVPTLYRFASAYRNYEEAKANDSLAITVLDKQVMLEYRYKEAQDLIEAILGFRA